MLASSPDAFLRVSGAGRGVGAGSGAEKDRNELIHACVGEKQVRGIGQQAGGGDDGVPLTPEKIEE